MDWATIGLWFRRVYSYRHRLELIRATSPLPTSSPSSKRFNRRASSSNNGENADSVASLEPNVCFRPSMGVANSAISQRKKDSPAWTDSYCESSLRKDRLAPCSLRVETKIECPYSSTNCSDSPKSGNSIGYFFNTESLGNWPTGG